MKTRPTDSEIVYVLQLSEAWKEKGLRDQAKALEKVAVYAMLKRDLSPGLPSKLLCRDSLSGRN